MFNLHTTEATENVKSIQRIPTKLLPNGVARNVLAGMARDGYDVYAYTPLQLDIPEDDKRWNVWVNGRRYALTEWLAEFNRSSQESNDK